MSRKSTCGSCYYRTATEMELARGRLQEYTQNEDQTRTIMDYFLALAGKEGHVFDEDVGVLLDDVLQVPLTNFPGDFLLFLVRNMTQ